jgi:hypothetical protein
VPPRIPGPGPKIGLRVLFRATSATGSAGGWTSSNDADGKGTINQARARCGDQGPFDLTLEWIRRHYLDEPSTRRLGDALARYADSWGCSATSPTTWTSSTCSTWWTTPNRRSSSSCRSRASSPGRCRKPSCVPRVRERTVEFIESRNRRIAAHVGAEPLMNSPAHTATWTEQISGLLAAAPPHPR